MLRNRSKAVPDGNGPASQHDKFRPDQHTLADIYRLFEQRLDRQLNLMKSHFDQLDELLEKTRETNQPPAGLEHDARQPHLAMEADITSVKKTCKRTEDAAASGAMNEDSSFVQVDHDPMCLTSFGDDFTEPPALPCYRDDVLIDKGAEAPKSCLLTMKMRTQTAAGGLLPDGIASTVTRTIFLQPHLWNFCQPEEIHFRTTSVQYARYSIFWKMEILETKTRQTMVFDLGGCMGRLRACPFWGGWRALLCGEVFVWTLRWYPRLERFWYTKDLNIVFKRGQAIRYTVRIAVDRCLPKTRLIRGSRRRQTTRGYGSCGDERISGNVVE